MSMTTTQTAGDWSRRPAFKLLSIGALLLLLLLPSAWVDAVISEREARQEAVRAEIARDRGPPQSVLGPILVVPYRVHETPAVWSGGQLIPATPGRRYAHIIPQRLMVDAKLSPEQRRRGGCRRAVPDPLRHHGRHAARRLGAGRVSTRMIRSCGIAAAALAATALLGLWLYAGPYGLNVLFRHGGT